MVRFSFPRHIWENLVLIPDFSSHILERNPQPSSLYKEEASSFYYFPKVDKAMLFTSVTEDFWVTKLGKITGVMTFSQGYTLPLKILVGNSATLESAPAQTGLHVRFESKWLGIRFIYWKEIFTCQRFLLLCHWHPIQSLNIFYRARKKKNENMNKEPFDIHYYAAFTQKNHNL